MTDQKEMFALLARWVERGWLREVDLALVHFFVNEVSGASPSLLLASALVSHQLGRGHVCLDLENTLNDPYMALSLPPDQEEVPGQEEVPQPRDLLTGWSAADWIGELDCPELVGNGESRTPLVLVGHRLYLRRYWRYERQVEAQIERRIQSSPAIADKLCMAEFKATLNDLFPPSGVGKTDWQKVACALAARSAFSIITGGPGTGKTTTVVRLLALLQSSALENSPGKPLQIRLAAPTGKAAARLKESISGAIGKLPAFVQNNVELKESIPTEVTTLHRLLGTRPDSRMFRHDARNPLPLDVLVVDEGSMVDLEMMAALLTALPAHAHLVLLGDKDQLASVEAGSVLGELCRRAQRGHFMPETAEWVKAMTGEIIPEALLDCEGLPLDQHVVMLRESHRFNSASGIGQLADAVNAGDAAKISAVWGRNYSDIRCYNLPDLEDPLLKGLLLGESEADATPEGCAGYLRLVRDERPALTAERSAFDSWAAKVLKRHSRFQLLCALRNGPFGVSGVNLRIESLLQKHGLIQMGTTWYEGRPVLVTRNDYRLGLMNGDIGITLSYPILNKTRGEKEWTTRVAFPKSDGSDGIHWILPSRLLSAETVFALTVHKSQGSEFDHCALLLPPERNPVLTRELVYTGITRGKSCVSMVCVGNDNLVVDAASRTVQRSGGLFL